MVRRRQHSLKIENFLIRRVLHALRIVTDDGCPAPVKAFSEDISLQLVSDGSSDLGIGTERKKMEKLGVRKSDGTPRSSQMK